MYNNKNHIRGLNFEKQLVIFAQTILHYFRKKTTNQDLKPYVKGDIDFKRIEEYLDENGSYIRYMDFDDIPIISTGAASIHSVLSNNKLSANQLDGIIYAGLFKDDYEPSTASSIAHELGIAHAKTLDVGAACSGMAHAVEVATGWFATNPDINIIALVSVDLPFRHIYWEINTEIELQIKGPGLTTGAGSSALIVVRKQPKDGIEIRQFISYDDATYAPVCKLPINGYFFSDSNKLIKPTGKSLLKTMKKTNYITNNTWVIPHQPSTKISSIAKLIKTDPQRIMITHHLYGNTVSSAWVSAYDYLLKMHYSDIQNGDPILIKTMAGGFCSLSIIGSYLKEEIK